MAVKNVFRVLFADLLLIVIVLLLPLSRYVQVYVGGILFFIGIAVIYLIYRQYIIPLQKIEHLIEMAADNSEEDIEGRVREIAQQNGQLWKFYGILEDYVESRMRSNIAKIFDKQTELTALQSQINPHFLYNTLDSIRGDALLNDDEVVAGMIGTLASYFRYSISRKGSQVRLREELNNVENYMKIQRYRFNNRYALEIIVDEEDQSAFDNYVPRLILQPVVENALYHGLDDMTSGGRITIEVVLSEQDMVLTVSDNGKGMSAEELEEINERIHSRNTHLDDGQKNDQRNTGIALPNINKRIRLLYGNRYGVDVYSSPGQGTDVEIMVPIRNKAEETEI